MSGQSWKESRDQNQAVENMENKEPEMKERFEAFNNKLKSISTEV